MNLHRHSFVLVVLTGALGACSSKEKTFQEPVQSVAQADTTANVFHSTWSGGAAVGYSYDQFGSRSFDAWENGTQQGRTAYLQFYGYGIDPSSKVCFDETICKWDPMMGCNGFETVQYCYYTRYYWESGWGEIPTGDFRVGAHTAHLTTDLANDPNLYATRCTYDTQAWTYTCAPITTGSFDVTWRVNGFQSMDNQGTSSTTYRWFNGSYSSRTVGHSSQDSADVSGTVFGAPAAGSGTINQTKGVSIQRDIFKNTDSGGGGGGMDASIDSSPM